jgi:ABC-type branched-subunit amino acid transport system permease subunit
VPRGKLFGLSDLKNVWAMYSLVFAVFAGGFLLVHRAVHSPFGQVLKAIRENEARALSLGYDVNRYKLLAYVLSATLAGLAGATKVLVFELASLTDVHWTMSGEVVLMVLLGGLGTVFGPVVGALIIISMEKLPRPTRLLGDGDAGRDLRDLCAHLPPGCDRRAGAADREAAVGIKLLPLSRFRPRESGDSAILQGFMVCSIRGLASHKPSIIPRAFVQQRSHKPF